MLTVSKKCEEKCQTERFCDRRLKSDALKTLIEKLTAAAARLASE